VAVRQYKVFKQAAGKTAKSILVSTAVRLAPFNLLTKKGRCLLKKNNFEFRAKRFYAIFAIALVVLTMFVVPAFATDDPLTVVDNLSEFIFSLIRAIGLILLGFGILQVGLALKSHDASQRANGMLTVAGGIVITFTKEILTLITGG
jgi:hypothetical protein